MLGHYNDCDGQYFAGEYRRLKLWRTADTVAQMPIAAAEAPLKASAIWQTFRALEQVERPAMESGWKNFVSAMNLSWKTGTSFGFRDAWAVGVNPEYVIGVWVGNADGEGRPGLVGVRAAAPILFEVASLLPCQRQWHPPLEEMKPAVVCRRSGYRASIFCDETDTLAVCAGLPMWNLSAASGKCLGLCFRLCRNGIIAAAIRIIASCRLSVRIARCRKRTSWRWFIPSGAHGFSCLGISAASRERRCLKPCIARPMQ